VASPNNFAKVFLKKTDIEDKRVSGDTLSHLLLLTSEPGAVFMGLPQFFWRLQPRLALFSIHKINSDADKY
jgi:hypothetical protein